MSLDIETPQTPVTLDEQVDTFQSVSPTVEETPVVGQPTEYSHVDEVNYTSPSVETVNHTSPSVETVVDSTPVETVTEEPAPSEIPSDAVIVVGDKRNGRPRKLEVAVLADLQVGQILVYTHTRDGVALKTPFYGWLAIQRARFGKNFKAKLISVPEGETQEHPQYEITVTDTPIKKRGKRVKKVVEPVTTEAPEAPEAAPTEQATEAPVTDVVEVPVTEAVAEAPVTEPVEAVSVQPTE